MGDLPEEPEMTIDEQIAGVSEARDFIWNRAPDVGCDPDKMVSALDAALNTLRLFRAASLNTL